MTTAEGVSIVLMMLRMRGGVLAIAPMIDRLTGRKATALNWVALGLTLSSLRVATGNPSNLKLTARHGRPPARAGTG